MVRKKNIEKEKLKAEVDVEEETVTEIKSERAREIKGENNQEDFEEEDFDEIEDNFDVFTPRSSVSPVLKDSGESQINLEENVRDVRTDKNEKDRKMDYEFGSGDYTDRGYSQADYNMNKDEEIKITPASFRHSGLIRNADELSLVRQEAIEPRRDLRPVFEGEGTVEDRMIKYEGIDEKLKKDRKKMRG